MRTPPSPNLSLIVAAQCWLYTLSSTPDRISLIVDVAPLRNSCLAGYKRASSVMPVPWHRHAPEVNQGFGA